MKSLSVPLICLILVFSFWFFSASYTQCTESRLTPILEETFSYAAEEDWDNATASYEYFFRQWSEYRRIYSYYMNSSDMEEIERSVRRGFGTLQQRTARWSAGKQKISRLLLKDLTAENSSGQTTFFKKQDFGRSSLRAVSMVMNIRKIFSPNHIKKKHQTAVCTDIKNSTEAFFCPGGMLISALFSVRIYKR